MVDDAYAACLRIAHEHYENFPVASRLVPPAMRRHVAAVYAFARGADDIADEPGRTTEERLRLLSEWSNHLRRPPRTPVFVALADTRSRFDLPIELFDDLLSAFAQDVTKTRYADWEEVLDYCRRSANPVGRLVLRLARVRDPQADAWSDAVCTALQLTNFWQDLAVDWSRGRLYVPESEWRAAGATTDALDHGLITAEWRHALSQCAAVTRALFEQGRPVCDVLRGRLRYELRATWLGGTRVLDRVQQVQFDVFNRRPTLRAADAIVIAWKALTWREIPPFTTRS